jgi:hypothetical protein
MADNNDEYHRRIRAFINEMTHLESSLKLYRRSQDNHQQIQDDLKLPILTIVQDNCNATLQTLIMLHVGHYIEFGGNCLSLDKVREQFSDLDRVTKKDWGFIQKAWYTSEGKLRDERHNEIVALDHPRYTCELRDLINQ